jgi:hypothetical protein
MMDAIYKTLVIIFFASCFTILGVVIYEILASGMQMYERIFWTALLMGALSGLGIKWMEE